MLKILSIVVLSLVLGIGGLIALGNVPLDYTQVEGQVLDETTAAPIKGVQVLVRWTGTFKGMESSYNVCTWITASETDDAGKYKVKVAKARLSVMHKTWGQINGGLPKVRFFKPQMKNGESAWWHGTQRPRYSTKDENSRFAVSLGLVSNEAAMIVDGRLQPALDDAHDRLRSLIVDSRPESDCTSFTDDGKVTQFYKAIADEARQTAKSGYELALAALIDSRANAPLWANVRQSHNVVGEAGAIAYGSDLDARDINDKTPLMRAAENGDAATVAELLKSGANPNRTTFGGEGINDGFSALTLAIKKYGYHFNRPANAANYVEVVKVLLQDKRTNPNLRKEKNHYTALLAAVKASQLEMVELLLNAGADPNISAGYSEKALIFAAEKRHPTQPDANKIYELIKKSVK